MSRGKEGPGKEGHGEMSRGKEGPGKEGRGKMSSGKDKDGKSSDRGKTAHEIRKGGSKGVSFDDPTDKTIHGSSIKCQEVNFAMLFILYNSQIKFEFEF